MDFYRALEESCRRRNSLLCIGLDPRVSGDDPRTAILEFNRRIIEQTREYAAAFKPNIAFYERHGSEGLRALRETIDLISPDTPLIIDAKRNDIGATAQAYAAGLFEHFGAGAVTLNAYMGKDSVAPFLEYGDRGVFLLCRTSNPGAADFQNRELIDTEGRREPVFVAVARTCVAWGPQVGLVVAGNDVPALQLVRSLQPNVWMLAPGIGAQGGTVEDAVKAGIRKDGLGILPHVGRAIVNADSPGRAAKEFRDQINRARAGTGTSSVTAESGTLKTDVLRGLIDAECFQLGEFVLKSGKKSPFYIDLRMIGSRPRLLSLVARAYAGLLWGLEYDRIAAVPLAGLPLATAVCLGTDKPLIYPRLDKKSHGRGRSIEGRYQRGDRVVLLDDLITTGSAKLEAAEVLRAEGLEVEHLAVLLERGAQGRRDMEAAGIRLHAFADVRELFDECLRTGLIDERRRDELYDFVSAS